MDFELPESHREIQRSVREFCARHVKPFARGWDEAERFPTELVGPLAEAGLLGIRVPEAYGGSGLDTLAYAVIVEEVAKCDGSLALTLASHNGLGTGHLLRFGSDAQRERYLPRAASGEWLAAWALTEPGSGSDAAGLRTTAVRRGEGWVLNGTKMFITQGIVGGFCVVLASTNLAAKQRGITAFVVEHGTPGFKPGRHLEKLGMRSSDTAELVFEDCYVPDSQRVGEVDHGFLDTLQILDRGRVSIAALALGLGEGSLDCAVAYAKDRQQFGRPIGDFQAIQWMLADSRAELEAARLLVYRAAWLADREPRYSREASMAKLFASEAGTRACNRALQVHGGYGYTREFPVERHLRDAKLCELGEGTSEVQRLVIARHLLEQR
ncbi:MAG: acyl-CoA dehydrogenase family protein [Deltaproteobacteria bacterium]|nr:acyl-CoA dehydrogenase family protein [Deltaproteobacteria bacterium]